MSLYRIWHFVIIAMLVRCLDLSAASPRFPGVNQENSFVPDSILRVIRPQRECSTKLLLRAMETSPLTTVIIPATGRDFPKNWLQVFSDDWGRQFVTLRLSARDDMRVRMVPHRIRAGENAVHLIFDKFHDEIFGHTFLATHELWPDHYRDVEFPFAVTELLPTVNDGGPQRAPVVVVLSRTYSGGGSAGQPTPYGPDHVYVYSQDGKLLTGPADIKTIRVVQQNGPVWNNGGEIRKSEFEDLHVLRLRLDGEDVGLRVVQHGSETTVREEKSP